ncbi:MAG: hypothetical protein U9Q98_08760, partial [Bacteroidota bacterium]|nr:hypothetical protein [Bacteroidota bacterium]
MKKNVILTTLLLLVGTFCLTTVWAQSPEKMSYQAVIRDASDDLITDTQVGMQISILQGSAGGTAVYVETQTPTTNANGLVSIEIGAGTVESGDFTAIDWTAGPYFIKTETDPAGGTSYSITGTSQLLSVPYALHAKHADAVAISGDETAFDGWDKDSSDDFDGEYNSLNGTPTNVSTFTNDAGYLTTIPNQAIGIEYTSSSYGLWVISASPEFRGRLYDSNDNPLSGILSMSFGLYDNETSGTQVWSEVIDLAFTDGFFSGTLGTNTPFSDVFETYPELFLEITVGGETLTPRFQIEQAGKAFYADKAGEIDYANVNNTPDLSGFISTETDPSVPVGTQTGEMQYWNGSVWITVPAGTQGNILTFVNNAPMWRPVIEDKDVLNPATGKVWMDKNLGASQVADSSNDYNAYGALFQWGRLSDGHEC